MSAAHDQHEFFATTRWTAVQTAGRSDTTRARQALGELCQAYWYPLYAYVRRRGHAPQDAEDLTQGFFERLLALNSIADVSREKGKFRAFLLAAMNNYMAVQRERASAQKRDVNRTISLDAEAAEDRYRHEPVDERSPEVLFERQWAMTLLETVVQRLREEYEATGRGTLFMELRFTIALDRTAMPYGEIAGRLALSEEAVRVAVHRLRKRYRQALREEIAQTVSSEAEIAGELEYLRRVLSS
jgi:RNA polymerase sigma factor (sigma-70 family)